MWAAVAGRSGVLALLLGNGADINLQATVTSHPLKAANSQLGWKHRADYCGPRG